MRPNPAIASLFANRAKTMLSVAGIGFAILLIFMQLGFLGGVSDTATVIYDKMEFDLLARSPDYLHLLEGRTVPRALLAEIESFPQVASVRPLSISISGWLTPETKFLDGRDLRAIVLIGMDPDRPVFSLNEIRANANLLKTENTALIDRLTAPDYGPVNGIQFGDLDVARKTETEIAFQKIQLVGHFRMGTGLSANGSVVVGEHTYAALSGVDPQRQVTLGLIQLDSQADASRVQSQFAQYYADRFPAGAPIQILTKSQVRQLEQTRWVWRTPIGMIFSMGVVVAMVVGTTIVYMVLASDISNRMHELATLKAMGYTNGYLVRSILLQSLVLAIVAFLPAWLLAVGLYDLTYRLSNIPLAMPVGRVVFVLLLSVAMCGLSGLIALRKVWQAEPASLF